VQTLDLADNVVVQLQALEFVQTQQVIYLDNILVAQGQVSQLPQWHVVLVEDPVLLVVLDEIVPKTLDDIITETSNA
jgi:hypothetical protein